MDDPIDLISDEDEPSDEEDEDAGEADDNPVNWAAEGQMTGHAFIGQFVTVAHGGRWYVPV